MADANTVSDAITELMQRGNSCEAVRAVRGETFFHLAEVWEAVSVGGDAAAELAETRARQCRERGRSLLGRVG